MSAPVERWDPIELQRAEGKTILLEFLPYSGADGRVGYTPAWVRRGYGYGRWQEFFTDGGRSKGTSGVSRGAKSHRGCGDPRVDRRGVVHAATARVEG